MRVARSGRTLFLPGALLLSLVANSAAAQNPTRLYDPVLQHIQAEYVSKPLVLYTTILRLECYSGGCDEPWAGTLPQAWLENTRSRGLIAEFCTFTSDRCLGRNGKPVVRADGAYVMLSTTRPCGEGCADVLATHTLIENETSIRRYRLYRLVRGPHGWIVESVQDGGHAIIG